MNSLQTMLQQFRSLWQSMAPSQRLTLVAVPLFVLAGLGMLLWQNRSEKYTALSWGKVFPTEELIAAEQALIQAGLTDFKREGQRIMVPERLAARGNAALLEFDALPADLGSQMLKQFESLSPFSTDKQRQEIKEAMLLRELRQVIRAVPDLDDARVAIANPSRRNTWGERGRVTATVTVRPKPGRELSSKLVHALRASVASMVPDLKSADVTVFDVLHGVSHTGDAADDPFDSKLLNRIKEMTRQYEQQIQKDLAYIPNVGVTVHIDVENLKSSVIRTQQIDPKKTAPVFTNEFNVTDTQSQRPTGGEPGQGANRPGRVATATGPDRSRQFSETENRTVNGVSFEVTEKELIAAMPKAVQVSISIPREYYRSIVTQRTAAGEKDSTKLDAGNLEKEITTNVQKSVARLIPQGSPPEAVTVNSIDRLPMEVPDLAVPILDRVLQTGQQWGGAIVMLIFTAFALITIRNSMPAPPAEAIPSLDPNRLKMKRPDEEAEEEKKANKQQTPRDRLQSIVRDNPEATATVIGKWIQAAK